MNRIIKFRAWDKLEEVMIPSRQLSFHEYVTIAEHFDDDDKVFMQYIGLKDSMKNEIYEGDIVSVHSDDYHDTTVHEVIYNADGHYPAFELNGFNSESNSFSEVIASGNYMYSVIGNIYEHPNLLTNNAGRGRE